MTSHSLVVSASQALMKHSRQSPLSKQWVSQQATAAIVSRRGYCPYFPRTQATAIMVSRPTTVVMVSCSLWSATIKPMSFAAATATVAPTGLRKEHHPTLRSISRIKSSSRHEVIIPNLVFRCSEFGGVTLRLRGGAFYGAFDTAFYGDFYRALYRAFYGALREGRGLQQGLLQGEGRGLRQVGGSLAIANSDGNAHKWSGGHQKVNIFYNGLGTMNSQLLDSYGPVPGMTPAQALTVIQNMSNHSQKWYDGLSSRNIDSSSISEGIAAIVNKLDSMGHDMKKLKQNVHAIQVGCQTCRGAHLDKECPLNKDVKSIEEVKYGEFDRPFPNNSKNDGRFNRGASGYDQPSSREKDQAQPR
ncbi:hypothetical protein Tco_0091394 [Tanacetum coccineum]